MSCSRGKGCSICLIVSGIALTIAMVVCILLGVFDELINDTIRKKVELKEGSETFKNWKSPSSHVYMQYFMFNLTNPDGVKNGDKPSVKQLGPYSYREIRHNVPRYFNHSINTIVYNSEKSYIFDNVTSCAGCDPVVDKIYTINIPLLKISQLLSKVMDKIPKLALLALAPIINKFLGQEKVFPARSVQELLWGYDDLILASLDNLTMVLNRDIKKYGLKFPNVSSVNPLIKLQTNNSNTSAEIHTGVGNINRIGEYVSYNNFSFQKSFYTACRDSANIYSPCLHCLIDRTLPWWHTKWANMINGTDASMFHPGISKHEKLQTFVSDVCRSLFLRYYSTIDVRGIKLYKYFAPPELFKYTPDVRAGFCVPNNLTCVPDGLLDISVCQPMNVPIVVSLPHFLYANESVIKSVDGMHPNEDAHATFVSVEPNTGITMKANKRIQINVAVDKVEHITQLKNLRKVYLPVLFVNESAIISKDDAEKFKKDVLLLKKIVDIGKYVLIGVGCLIMLIGLGLFRYKSKRAGNTESSLQSHTTENEVDNGKSPLLQGSSNYVA